MLSCISSGTAMHAGLLPVQAMLAASAMTHLATASVLVDVTVICADLSEEERAHVETMLRADLSVRAPQIAWAKLECQTNWVTAEFRSDTGAITSHGEPKVSHHEQIAEQLIWLSDRLTAGGMAMGSNAPAEGSTPIPQEDVSTAVGGNQVASVPGAESARNGGEPEAFTTVAVNRQSQLWRGGILSVTGSVQPLQPKTVHAPRPWLNFELSGGAQFDAFLEPLRGMVGPNIGLSAVAYERFVMSSMLGISWSIDSSADFALRDYRAGLGFEWRWHPRSMLGARALVTAMEVLARVETTQPRRWSLPEPACQLYLGYRWNWRSFSFALAPVLTAYWHRRVVRRDETAALEVPTMLFGIVAQTAFRP